MVKAELSIEVHRKVTNQRTPKIWHLGPGSSYSRISFPLSEVDSSFRGKQIKARPEIIFSGEYVIDGCTIEVQHDKVQIKNGDLVLRRYSPSDIATRTVPFLDHLTTETAPVLAEFALDEEAVQNKARRLYPNDPKQQETHFKATLGPWRRFHF